MQIDSQKNILKEARFIESPHYDKRPDNTSIDMIVVHNISLPPGQFLNDSIEKFFLGKLDSSLHPYFKTIEDLKVSSHLFINREGVITQFVPFDKRAWHAGESFFQGKTGCNDFSIGIELEGEDERPYEKIQYTTLAKIISTLMEKYSAITRDRIVGHSTIAPNRKTDPGPAFDWTHLDYLLHNV